jgi:NADH:ubiquinone oxidoreductase subunit
MSHIPLVKFAAQAAEAALTKIKAVGVWKAMKHMAYYNTIHNNAKHVGTDQFGNKYFEDQNDYYTYTRSRFVELASGKKVDINPSNVPAEWHNWLHYTVHSTPVSEPRSNPVYQVNHMETKMSNLAAEANFVPVGYMLKPHDIKSDIKVRPRAYERWDPAQAGAKKSQ